jgi:hypothetical protein
MWERFHREKRDANHLSRWNRSHNQVEAGLKLGGRLMRMAWNFASFLTL